MPSATTCRSVTAGSGADVCHNGGLLREGPVLPGLQSALLHHGSVGGAAGISSVSACAAGVARALLRVHEDNTAGSHGRSHGCDGCWPCSWERRPLGETGGLPRRRLGRQRWTDRQARRHRFCRMSEGRLGATPSCAPVPCGSTKKFSVVPFSVFHILPAPRPIGCVLQS
jgi:hypothetical protein